ncbi:MAG: hypothetical protein AB7G44_07065 [Bacteroidia bacterium]
MLTLDKIREYIRLQKLPCWNLQLVQGGGFSKAVPIASFNPEKKPKAEEETADSADIEASIAQLENTLKFYNDVPNVSFKIVLKASKNANQGSVYGPFDFSINGQAAPIAGLAGVQQQSVMSGLGQVAELMGIVNQLNQGPEQKLNQLAAKEEILQAAKDRLQEERIALAIDKQALENAKEKLKEDREKFKEEIKEAKDKYEKNLSRVGDATEIALGKLIETFTGETKTAPLGKVETTTKEEPATEEQKLVESIAENIFENADDKAHITNIGVAVQHLLDRPELYEEFITIAKAE